MVRKSRTKNRNVDSKKNSEQIVINKTTLWQIASGILAVALITVIIITFTGKFTAQAPSVPGTASQPSPSDSEGASLEGANTLGDENAPVVFVEYSSFTCPFCGRFNEETYPQILDNYVEEGSVLYVYKHFPMNEMDLIASNYAECAGEQGLFFEYKDAIYDSQDSIGQPGFFEGIAESLGLDMNSWQSCAEQGTYVEEIIASRDEALQVGIQGAPGFVINGETFARGAQPYNVFEQEIQRALQN